MAQEFARELMAGIELARVVRLTGLSAQSAGPPAIPDLHNDFACYRGVLAQTGNRSHW